MRRDLGVVLSLLVVGLLAHPVGGVLSLFFGMSEGQVVSGIFSPGALFFMGVSLLMLGGHAAVGFLLLTAAKGVWAVRAAVYTDFCVAAALAVAAQTWAWTEAHKDAQGGLLFLFLPLYAALLAGAIGLVSLPLLAALRWVGLAKA